jgi:hypothetical protein
MTLIDKACYERGCACYDSRVDRDGVEVVQREWVGLTDEDMQECIKTADYNQGQYKRTPYWAHLSTAIEAKLKEKNT